jgi:hypothetical protein
MKPCVSEATTMPRSFAEDVADFAAAGCPAMEVWLTKLEEHLAKNTAADTRKLVEDHGLTLAAASYQGGLLLSQSEQRQAHFEHFRRRLDLCQYFGIRTMLVVADFVERVTATDLERAVLSFARRPSGQPASMSALHWNFAARALFALASTPQSPWYTTAALPMSASISMSSTSTPVQANLMICNC